MSGLDITRPIPSFILQKQNIIKLIIYTSLFALIFINVYAPFGISLWFKVNKLQLFFYSSLIILTGIFVVVISRMIMYYYAQKYVIKYWHYFIWVFAEIFFMAIFYSIFETVYLNDKRDYLTLLKISMQNTSLVLLLPYSVLWLYFSYIDKRNKLEKITFENDKISDSNALIPFYDEKGILRVSIKLSNLLYLEANDNYVNIYYFSQGKIHHFMLRNSLRNLESLFERTDIIRCHRSYMVNFSKVKLVYKSSSGLIIELDTPETIQVPVSKNYSENILKNFLLFQNI